MFRVTWYMFRVAWNRSFLVGWNMQVLDSRVVFRVGWYVFLVAGYSCS